MSIKKLTRALIGLGFLLGFVLIYGSQPNKTPTIIALIVVGFIIAAIWFWRHRT